MQKDENQFLGTQKDEKQLPIFIRSVMIKYFSDVKKRQDLVNRLLALPDSYYERLEKEIKSESKYLFSDLMSENNIRDRIISEKIIIGDSETHELAIERIEKLQMMDYLGKCHRMAEDIEFHINHYEKREKVKHIPEVNFWLHYINNRDDHWLEYLGLNNRDNSIFQGFIKYYPLFEYDPKKTLNENREIAREILLETEAYNPKYSNI